MFLIALGLAGLVFGVGTSEVRKFENAAARDIASRLLGDQKRVRVRTKMDPLEAIGGKVKSATIFADHFTVDGLPFFTEPTGSKRGRLGEMKFDMSDFELTRLPVKAFHARIPNCRFDLGLAQRHGQIRLTESGEGEATVEVTGEGLATFVKRKYPSIREIAIQLVPGKAILTGAGRFVVLDARFRIETQLGSSDGNQISMIDPTIWVNDQLAEPAATKAILAILNPVIDLDNDLKLFGALRSQAVEIGNGSLFAKGPAHIPLRPTGTEGIRSLLMRTVSLLLHAE
jgi:hypothetical protein